MPKTKIKPLGENVLIQLLKSGKKTDTGIFLPESVSQEKPQEGKVMATGESKEIKVARGQKVIFRPFSGTEVRIDDEDYSITDYKNILAIIE